MWFLRHKSTHKRFIFWCKLGAFIGAFHLICLFFIFFVYQDGVQNLAFLITPHLLKRDIEFHVAIETIKRPEQKQKKRSKAPENAMIKQIKQKEIVKPKHKEKEVVKPVSNDAQQKKVAPVKKESEPIDLHLSATQNSKGLEQEYVALYQAIASHWAPPPGVPAECTCAITVTIDWQGNLADMKVNAASGMLVYDLAARAALSELAFPRFVWGKSISITFTT